MRLLSDLRPGMTSHLTMRKWLQNRARGGRRGRFLGLTDVQCQGMNAPNQISPEGLVDRAVPFDPRHRSESVRPDPHPEMAFATFLKT